MHVLIRFCNRLYFILYFIQSQRFPLVSSPRPGSTARGPRRGNAQSDSRPVYGTSRTTQSCPVSTQTGLRILLRFIAVFMQRHQKSFQSNQRRTAELLTLMPRRQRPKRGAGPGRGAGGRSLGRLPLARGRGPPSRSRPALCCRSGGRGSCRSIWPRPCPRTRWRR
jgi:hypothetical protein